MSYDAPGQICEVEMNKSLFLAVAVASLASCATSRQPVERSAKMQETFDKLIAGKTAGQAALCLPLYRSNDMVVIDEQTLAFRDGRTTWVNRMVGSCSQLDRGGYAVVNQTFGSQLCSGEIARVVDTNTGMTVGSCSYGDFVPYRPAG